MVDKPARDKPKARTVRITPEQYRDERPDVSGWHYGSAFGWREDKPDAGEL